MFERKSQKKRLHIISNLNYLKQKQSALETLSNLPNIQVRIKFFFKKIKKNFFFNFEPVFSGVTALD